MNIGEQAYANALKKRKKLKDELAEIDRFIALCRQFSEDRDPDTHRHRTKTEPMSLSDVLGDSPERIRKLCRELMIEHAKPMTRAELVIGLETHGVVLKSKDKANYIGTILWRAKDQFVNLESFGYWPKDTPYGPAEYGVPIKPSIFNRTDDT